MAQFEVPKNEVARVAELHELALLDTEPSPSFDAITATATELFSVPMSAVSLIDTDRQWFKSALGLGSTTETPREIAFCAHPVASGQLLEIEDALLDDRFAANRLVRGHPDIRFYAGAPIISESGNTLGTVCILDTVPRQLDNGERSLLTRLATMAAALCQEHHTRNEAVQTLERVLETIGDAVLAADDQGRVTFLNPAASSVSGWPLPDALGRPVTEVLKLVDDAGQVVACPIKACLATGQSSSLPPDTLLVTRSGLRVPIEDSTAIMVDAASNRVGVAVVFRDVSAQRELQQELRYLAGHDSLTGSLNRLEFERELEISVGQAQHPLCAPALMYLDLDQFKVVNDQFGHGTGDDLLRRVAEAISSQLRPTDTFARLGGDEFGVIARHRPVSEVVALAARINEAVHELGSDFMDLPVHTAVSIGISTGLGANGLTSTIDAMKQADIACYVAKQAGGGRAQLFEHDATEIIEWTGNIRWLQAINNALDDDLHTELAGAGQDRNHDDQMHDPSLLDAPRDAAVQLDAQPILPLQDPHGPLRLEVLTRMYVEGERHSPEAFMTELERHRLGPRFDQMIIARTLETLARHPDAVHRLGSVSINLCGQSVGDQALARRIGELLDTWQIPGDLLCFEITESSATSNVTQAARFISELAERGCQFALDDFGTGLSSFTYLQELAIDVVKVDGMFVRGIGHEPISRLVVTSIVEACDVLGAATVAEGVETEESLELVRDLGINFGQGFHLGRPLPLADWLAADQASSAPLVTAGVQG